MAVGLIFPVLLSSLIISAHFYRAGVVLLAIFCLVLPLVLLYRKPIAVRTMQLFLLLAAAEWGRTMLIYIQTYQNNGTPWYRLALILSAVIVFTLGSTCVFRAKRMKSRYKMTRS